MSAFSKRKSSTKFIETFDESALYIEMSTTSCCNNFCISKIPFQYIVEDNKKMCLTVENSRIDFVLNSLPSNAPIARQGEINKRTLLTH